MRALGAVRNWPLPVLFDGVVGKSLSVRMLAVPDRLRESVAETNHVVLPVANVIPKLLPKNRVSFVVGVKVEVEGINQARSMVIHDDGSADGSIRFATAVGRHASEPWWLLSDTLDRRQIYTRSTLCIQRIEIIQSQWADGVVDWDVVGLRFGMRELRSNIGGEIGILGVEPDKRCWPKHQRQELRVDIEAATDHIAAHRTGPRGLVQGLVAQSVESEQTIPLGLMLRLQQHCVTHF